ncbi:S8 family serine peptidase [Candidatus Pacearchaeota archaeon]|nr:S8 family serine peptidase [Candidatus Pacearchaeota archaeon]
MTRNDFGNFKKALVGGAFALASMFGQTSFGGSEKYVSDRVVVKLNENTFEGRYGKEVLDDVVRRHGIHEMKALHLSGSKELSGTYTAKIAHGEKVEDVIGRLKKDARIAYAEPDFYVHCFYEPNDSLYNDLWGLKKIQADKAWDSFPKNGDGVPLAGNNITVAVIDTGLDYNQIDVGDVWTNPVDGARGFDFVNEDTDPMDDNGHGTHVAGIVAGRGNNNEGIIGVSYGAKIMPLKVIGASGRNGASTDIARAIIYAADNGANVINMSIGTSGAAPSHLEEAVDYAFHKNVLLVAAAGNESADVSGVFPANMEHVIAVSNLTSEDVRSASSNYGAGISVGAPGTEILSLSAAQRDADFDNNTVAVGADYRIASGTSMAAPHVSGLAALVLGRFPGTFPDAMRAHLEMTADIPSGWDTDSGAGRVNGAGAMGTLPQGFVSALSTSDLTEDNPKTDGNWVAWRELNNGVYSIKARQIDGGEEISIDSDILSKRMGAYKCIENGWLIYSTNMNPYSNSRAILYNLNTKEKTQLSNGVFSVAQSIDNGRVLSLVNNVSEAHIKDINSGNENVLTLPYSAITVLDMSGDNFVYAAKYALQIKNIYGKEISTNRDFTIAQNLSDSSCNPQISERMIVWQNGISGARNIYGYDIGVDLKHGTGDDRGPFQITKSGKVRLGDHFIRDRYLLFSDWRNNNNPPGSATADVFAFDFGEDKVFGTNDDRGEFIITPNNEHQYEPNLGGNILVWTDTRNNAGTYYGDIYMARLPQNAPLLQKKLNLDYDRDGDIDMIDFGHLQSCFSGLENPLTFECSDVDFDRDNDVDKDDLNKFDMCLSGPGIPTNCNFSN